MPPSIESVSQQIRAEVSETSLAAVARKLDVHRHTLASFLSGGARAGTCALIVQRALEVKR